jgi:cyclic pyranopterin phosphate synthase
MDVGSTNGWQMADVVPAAEVVAAIDAELPLEPVPPAYPGEVATRWRYRDGEGEVGVIGSVTQPFCGTCTRARLSTDGKLFTCLFANHGTDLRALLRGGGSDEELHAILSKVWAARDDRYSEIRGSQTVRLGAPTPPAAGSGTDPDPERIEMSYIGG